MKNGEFLTNVCFRTGKLELLAKIFPLLRLTFEQAVFFQKFHFPFLVMEPFKKCILLV